VLPLGCGGGVSNNVAARCFSFDVPPAYMTRVPYPHPTSASGGIGKQVRKRVVAQGKALGSVFVEVAGSEDLRLEGVGCGAGSGTP
jgi:hypothetical protein